jgi:hypothetical protein
LARNDGRSSLSVSAKHNGFCFSCKGARECSLEETRTPDQLSAERLNPANIYNVFMGQTELNREAPRDSTKSRSYPEQSAARLTIEPRRYECRQLFLDELLQLR